MYKTRSLTCQPLAIPDRYTWEYNDCVVSAITIAANMPYPDAHSLCKSWGREDKGATFYTWDLLNSLFPNTRMESATGGVAGMTLGQIMPQLAHGRYVVLVKRHAFAVVDGIIRDSAWVHGKRLAVRAVWKVS
jgi:hypothetical protein